MEKSYQTFRKFITDKTLLREHFSALQYAALLQEIRIAIRKSTKKETLNLKVLAELEQKNKKKESDTHKLIREKYFLEIKKLRESGKPWLFICAYLKKAHKLKVSHTYLIKTFKEESEC